MRGRDSRRTAARSESGGRGPPYSDVEARPITPAGDLLPVAYEQNPGLGYVTWGPDRLVRTGFAGEVGMGMKVAAAVLAPLLGRSPEDAIRPIADIIDTPSPGRAAYRGAKARPLTVGAHDEKDAARLASAVEKTL
ncbi:hypothetical protein [Nocardia sp. NPDC002869]|uniref:hypothetical protein n=1 Tax=Nocardia sp. NPDC002869 TaxID=3161032 RepID=UPI00398CA40B